MIRTKLPFKNAAQLTSLINTYFENMELKKPSLKSSPAASANKKTTTKPVELPTFTGLALYLGFASMEDFQDYERNGKLAPLVKRARLRIQAIYEKRLHIYAPTGAIFALKCMGWCERADITDKKETSSSSITVIVVESGPAPANSEQNVVM